MSLTKWITLSALSAPCHNSLDIFPSSLPHYISFVLSSPTKVTFFLSLHFQDTLTYLPLFQLRLLFYLTHTLSARKHAPLLYFSYTTFSFLLVVVNKLSCYLKHTYTVSLLCRVSHAELQVHRGLFRSPNDRLAHILLLSSALLMLNLKTPPSENTVSPISSVLKVVYSS